MNIRESASSDYKLSKDEHTLHSGKWEWNSLFLKGELQNKFLHLCPRTSEILMSIPLLMKSTPFAYSFFSTLSPNTAISPHYGPCNIRIRCHFPLIVPKGDVGMRVGGQVVRWVEGQPLFFDDCYQHEVWNKAETDRVVLLFDIWYGTVCTVSCMVRVRISISVLKLYMHIVPCDDNKLFKHSHI